MISPENTQQEIDELRAAFSSLHADISSHFLGQKEVTELLLTCLFAGGHALLEGAPGLGKTTLVRSLSESVDLSFRRIQFTPDLMPPDILGTRLLEETDGGARRFRFEPGPIFTHVLLADEINRATPRTQSALLEAMQEHQVTLFGETRTLEEPFMVIATQNPIEMEGTYPLPEAQLDRFLFKIELSMPDRAGLAQILASTTGAAPTALTADLSRKQVVRLRELVRQVPASKQMIEFAAALVLATHPDSAYAPERVKTLVRYGSSPRGGQSLLLASKARALVKGRLHVALEDLRALAAPALRHRLILGYEGEASGVHPDELIADAFDAAKSQVGC